MKLLRVLLWSLLCLSPASSYSLDRNAFTFTKYELSIQIEPAQQRLGARGTVVLRNDSGIAQKNAVLQVSSSLDWRSIKVNGEPVQFVSQVYASDIDHTGALSEAVVTFSHEVLPKATVELTLGYEGVVPLDTTRLTRIGVPEETAKHSDWDQITPAFTALRGVGYVTWYPVAIDAVTLSEGNSVFHAIGDWKSREQASQMNAHICVNKVRSEDLPVVLVNNLPAGDVAAGGVGGASGGAASICGEYLFAGLNLTVPTIVAANFSLSHAPGIGTSPVVTWALPGHMDGAATFANAAQTVKALVTEWFGQIRLPVRVADLPDAGAAPFESGSMLLAPLQSTDPKLAEMLMAHQETHAAFHSPRAWIDEGIPHFAQALWREQQAGRQAALDYMGLHRTALATAEKEAAEAKVSAAAQSLISTTQEEFYRSKAMFVWWMLRDMVGELALEKAIAAYRPADDNQPAYLQKLVQTQSHRDLEWFFDDWVYRDRGLPDFRVASAYTRQMLKGAYLVTISVENVGGAGAEVPVSVRTDAGEVTSKIQVRAKSSAVVRVEVPSPPKEIVVNDGSVPESDTENNSFRVQQPKS
jgi:hypothetical protein